MKFYYSFPRIFLRKHCIHKFKLSKYRNLVSQHEGVPISSYITNKKPMVLEALLEGSSRYFFLQLY